MIRRDPCLSHPPDRITSTVRKDVLASLVFLPLVLGMALVLKLDKPGLVPDMVPVVVFMAAVPLAWCFIATVLAISSLRNLHATLHPVTGEQRVFGTCFLGVDLVNSGRFLPSLCLEVRQVVFPPDDVEFRLVEQYIDDLPALASRTLSWKLMVRLRGRFRLGNLLVRTRFPGSLVDQVAMFEDGREWISGPARLRLRREAHELLSGRRQAAGRPTMMPTALEEFAGIREYRRGDNPRMISWPHSFRMPPHLNQLVVREFEDPGRDDVCVLLDSCVQGSEDNQEKLSWQFEKALSFSGALIQLYASFGHRVRFVTVSHPAQRVEIRVVPGHTESWRIDNQLAMIQPITDPGQ